MKVIVYTVNLGNYDNLHPSPEAIFGKVNGWRYLYYTDNEAPKGWEKIEHQSGGRKESRYYKINSHLLPEHDISIYIDACYQFKKPLDQILEKYWAKESDVAICLHGKDNCVYQHLITCATMKLDSVKSLVKQVGKYAQEDYPEYAGLTENSLIIRRNNGIIKELNELWWKEYEEGSQRDQLSLPYALWKVKPKFTILPFSARDNKWLGGWHIHK